MNSDEMKDVCKARGKYILYFVNLFEVHFTWCEDVFKIEIVLTLKPQIQMILEVVFTWTQHCFIVMLQI